MPKIIDYLDSKGFTILKSNNSSSRSDFDAILRLGDIHHLVWYDNLRHFGIAVVNESRKKETTGEIKPFNIVLIPKPIYTTEEVDLIIKAICINK